MPIPEEQKYIKSAFLSGGAGGKNEILKFPMSLVILNPYRFKQIENYFPSRKLN